jgi:SAM-dependent methyltransferase
MAERPLPGGDPTRQARGAVRRVLNAAGLLRVAKAAVAGVLGNRRLRRYATKDFTSGKVVLGEKNRYVFPVFPLDWIRVDIDGADFDLDFERGFALPFADASQHLLYAAHLVEHLDEGSFEHLLRECRRILVRGGAIRIETPDADKLVRFYRDRDERALEWFRERRRQNLVERLGLPTSYLEDHLTVLGELSNYIDHSIDSGHIPVYVSPEEFDENLRRLDLESLARWAVSLQTRDQQLSGGHQNWMTGDKLCGALVAAGFERASVVDFGRTTIPGLALDAGFGSIREKRYRAFYSVYVEAFK